MIARTTSEGTTRARVTACRSLAPRGSGRADGMSGVPIGVRSCQSVTYGCGVHAAHGAARVSRTRKYALPRVAASCATQTCAFVDQAERPA